MRLDFSNGEQIITFIWAMLLGAALGLIYDVIRSLMSSCKYGGVAVFVADVLFLCFAGVVTFVFFILFSKGTIRFYALLGEGIGFGIWRATFSTLLRWCVLTVGRLIEQFFNLILKPVKSFYNLTIKLLAVFLAFIKNVAGKIKSKVFKFIKKIRHKSKETASDSKKV